jgi:uncharacterized sulfatase
MRFDRSLMIRCFGFVVALLPLVAEPVSAAPPPTTTVRKTNLIAIVTDDQGQWACGAYGNRDIHTPHMDRLATDGALFTTALTVTPVCSPSRAAYLSGLWPTQLGITDWISPSEAKEGVGLRATTWPAVLAQAGYRTALFGKWHLGELPQFHPRQLGFGQFYGFLGGGNSPMNPLLEVEGQPTRVEGSEPDVITTAAIAFLRAQASEPFAICLHYRAPHLPYGPVPNEDKAHYDDSDPNNPRKLTVPNLKGLDPEDVRRQTLAYYASVSSVDRNLGRLLAVLDELGLADNTIVSFTSDHGYNLGQHMIHTKGNGHWMAGGVGGPKRPNMWDTSLKVPLIVRWPGAVKPGMRIDYPVTNLDTFRTFLAALGVPVPAGYQSQGIDFTPLLRGETLPDRPATYAQYDLHNSGLAYMRSIRTVGYKYVKHFKARDMDELYDLQNDPGEERNLIGNRGTPESRTALAELKQQLATWQQSIDDPLLRSDK